MNEYELIKAKLQAGTMTDEEWRAIVAGWKAVWREKGWL